MHDVINHSHDEDGPVGPGDFKRRNQPHDRDYHERAFTVGIGGPVGNR